MGICYGKYKTDFFFFQMNTGRLLLSGGIVKLKILNVEIISFKKGH